MTWTITQLLEQAGLELIPAGATPRLDAEVLLANLLGRDRTWLLAHPESRVPRSLVQKYSERLDGRLAGQSVAHLTGIKEFFGLPLMVSAAVLIPRPTTELLVEAAQRRWSPTAGVVVDVGTGSGAVALALAATSRDWQIIGTDTSFAALRQASANARHLRLPGRVDWRFGSLLAPVESEHLGFIIANLPYLTPAEQASPELRAEPAAALIGGMDGFAYLGQLIVQAADRSDWLGLIIESTPRQAHRLRKLAATHWPSAEIENITDGRAVRGIAIWRH